ncbi:hypothetical protein [Shewanella fodinae]|jgi:hypothetical protein|uniref:Lipoprotein n=1 Tax=Shewanella fodinae TaxID=552357 RepID=A0A4V2RRI0_9GAMM|nr:hypothetical protein [Shewanella fodinae]TCN76339.1 hypothetical protein EDC91_1562 [Shewanella fodinae]
MKYQSLIIISALLALGGCGSDDDENVTPEPSYVSINDATSLKIVVDSIDSTTKAVTFSLTTNEGEPVTGAGANYTVMYLNIPGEQVSAFSIPWHKGVRFACSDSSDVCSGTLSATDTAGKYQFTPGSLEKLGTTVGQLKLAININGTLAQTKTDLLDIPSA